MFRLPADYANRLIGKGKKVDNVAFLEEVPNADATIITTESISALQAHLSGVEYSLRVKG